MVWLIADCMGSFVAVLESSTPAAFLLPALSPASGLVLFSKMINQGVLDWELIIVTNLKALVRIMLICGVVVRS